MIFIDSIFRLISLGPATITSSSAPHIFCPDRGLTAVYLTLVTPK